MLKQLIEDFQQGRNQDIITRIMEYIEIDYLKDETRTVEIDYLQDETKTGAYSKVQIDLPDPLMYVAYRIRAFREKMAKGAKSLRAGNMEEYRELEDIIYSLSNWFGEKYNTPEKVYKRINSLRDYLGIDWEDFKDLLEMFLGFDEDIEERKQEIRKELEPYILESLKYAISKVDIDREDKEIIKYINRAWLSKFVELQLIDSGKKRIQRKENGKVKSYVTEPKFEDINYMIIGKKIDIDKLKHKLNKQQQQFVDNVYEIVQKEIDQQNFENFRLSSWGSTVLNKRYIADCIGMEESAFKHKLRRIKNRLFK